jgi:BirA family biotin operon repressor/biotin-[acetyl-CoA-carboxylase] ligase
MFTLVLRPGLPVEQVARCTLAWGAAMAEVLDLRLKWPNDLVTADGGKVGGVLAELETHAEAFGDGWSPYVLLGVGVNVLQAAFPEDLPQARSLAQLGRDPAWLRDRARLIGALVAAIEAVDPGSPGLLEPWRARSITLGRRVRVGDREGVATGLREDGALLVDGAPVLAGDVELVG